MRWDWNSLLNNKLKFPTQYSSDYFPKADKLVQYLADFAEAHKINVVFNSNVVGIFKHNDNFKVSTTSGQQFETKIIICATGFTKENIPSIEGIENCDTYASHSTKLDNYKNKRVLLLGLGNSAFETAEHLSGTAAYIALFGRRPVRFAW